MARLEQMRVTSKLQETSIKDSMASDPGKMEESAVLDLRSRGPLKIDAQLSESRVRLSAIVILDLSFNALTQLPDLRVDAFPALRELRLGANRLTGSVEGLQRFAKLVSLSLDNNSLVSCNGLGSLEALQTLKLDGNQITDTRGLARLTSLTSLDLSRNELRKLQGLSNLVHLEELFLDGNQLTTLDGLGKCTSLSELSLRSNRVADFAGLSSLTRLDILRVDANKIEGLESLPKLPELTELHAGRNGLTSLDGLSDKLPSLEIVDVTGNRLEKLELCSRALAPLEGLAELSLQGNPLCEVFRSTREYRTAVREALPSVSYLDGFPVSQLDVPAERQSSSGGSGDRRINGESMSSLKDTRSSHELRRSWEPIDDPFAPSLEEMEAFKRRMGIHSDVDPFGRPGTAGRNGTERGTESTLAGQNLDEKTTNPVTDRSVKTLAKRRSETGEEGEEETESGAEDGTERQTEESGTERPLVKESQAGDGQGIVAARARQRHVLRVEDALADLNERLTSYHAHVTSVIGNLKQRLAPTFEAAEAAMVDNGYLVTATLALPAVPEIDLETPPGAETRSLEKNESSRNFESERNERTSEGKGEATAGVHLDSDESVQRLWSSTESETEGSSQNGGSRKREARYSARESDTIKANNAVDSDRHDNICSGRASESTGIAELKGASGSGRRKIGAALNVDKEVTSESLARATRIPPRGSARPRSERSLLREEQNKGPERAALTERRRRDRTGIGNGKSGTGCRKEGEVRTEGAAFSGLLKRQPLPKAAWVEERQRSAAESAENGFAKGTEADGAGLPTSVGDDPACEKEVLVASAGWDLESRPAKEALELFRKMFPESISDAHSDSAEKENLAVRSKGKGRLFHHEAGRRDDIPIPNFENRTTRTAPAAVRLKDAVSGSRVTRVKEVEPGLASGRRERAFKSIGKGVPALEMQKVVVKEDGGLKLPHIPVRAGQQSGNEMVTSRKASRSMSSGAEERPCRPFPSTAT